MARTQAVDYNEKRVAIRRRAAQMFADEGFDRTSMASLAAACGVSKALLYHYYNDKGELLYDVIAAHLSELCQAVADADTPDRDPKQRLLGLIKSLLEAYSEADNEHRVQINTLRFLPPEKQESLKDMERELVRRFSSAIAAANPALQADKALLMPVTMSLFGMLNWHYMWFREGGRLTRDGYAEMAMAIITDGTRNLT